MNKPIEQARDPLLKKAMAALERAAVKAREIAAQTGTALVVMQDGKVQHIRPDRVSESAEIYQPTKK